MVQNFRILNFNPLFSDVYCGISFSIRNDCKCIGEELLADGESMEQGISKQGPSGRLLIQKPGKWKKHESREYNNNVNKGFVTQVTENADFKSVSELNKDLKKIFIEPT